MGGTWENLKKRENAKNVKMLILEEIHIHNEHFHDFATFSPILTNFEGEKVWRQQCFQPWADFHDFSEI